MTPGPERWRWRPRLPRPGRLRAPWSYLLGALAPAAAFALRLALLPRGRPALVLFVLPVALASYLGGRGAGLLAAALGAGAGLWLVSAAGWPGGAATADLVQWLLFVVTALVIVGLADLAYRSGWQGEQAARRAARLARARRTHAALRASEQRLRAIFEDAAIGIVEVDEGFRLMAVNGRFADLLGEPPAELVGRTLHELTAPEDRGLTRDLEARARAGELRVFDYEKRYLRRDGVRVWVHVSVSVVRDGKGRFLRAIATAADVTERRAAQATQARLAAIVEGTEDAIIMKDLDGVIRAWNRGAERLFGLPEAEALGRDIRELLPPDRRSEEDEILARLRAGERIEHYETERLRRDGTRVSVSVSVSPVRDERGRLVGASKIARDISERRRAEAALADALREAEAERRRLAAVLDALPAGVAIADARGAFTHVNQEFKRIWGGPPTPRSADEYHAWHGWWADDGRPVETADWALARALSTGEVIVPGDVVEIAKFDGTGRATIVNAAAPVRDAEGRIVGGVLAEVDISAQKRAEAAAREAERRMGAVVEHLPSGLVVADLATQALHWNAEALRIHGYTGDEEQHRFLEALVAEHALQTLAGEPLPVERWPLPRLLRGEQFRDYELLVRNTRLGWDRVFSYSGVVIPAGDGVPALGLLAIRDVTDRTRAERAVREADRRKDEFLGMLSHELRNPLAPIRSSSYVLRHAPAGSPPWNRARDVIERQTAHLTRLVDDLLDVTRIARGKVVLHRGRVDLRELVARAAEDAHLAVEKRGVALEVELPPSRLWADGDPTRLTQILGNLLHNAAKFTRQGDRITVSLREVGAMAEIRVHDTGAGIDPELLPHLFDAFVQGKRTLARSEGGLGLGLALVRGLAALHGGSVRAASEGRGRGAEFVVTLPLVGALVDQRPRPAPARRARTPRRVLVVDDNADAAESLARLLELLGHRPVLAYDGPSALELARRHRPEVVLCDIGLPGMDGYQVARRLRAAQDGRLRLVAVSGYAGPEDQRRAREAGFDAHLAKPADPEQIDQLLEAEDPAPDGAGAAGAP